MSVCFTQVDAVECMSEQQLVLCTVSVMSQPVEETKAVGTGNLSFHLACAASEIFLYCSSSTRCVDTSSPSTLVA